MTEQPDDPTPEGYDRFDPAGEPKSYIYERLAAHLAHLIRTGRLRPNTPLPAEKRLAEECGVSLGTARHATQILRDQGLVVTLRSKGTYVCDVGASLDA